VEVDVLLIGGGVASARCARTLRRNGFAGSILLVGDERLPPYNRPPLTKELLRDDSADDLLLAEPQRWYDRHAVGLLTGTTVESLDPDARRVALADGRSVAFERCLLATGALPRELNVPGGGSAVLVRTIDDARALRSAALSATGDPAVVIGGGLVGVEVASGLASLGLRPTIVERTGALWGGAMGELLSEWALERLEQAGVTVLTNSTVTAIGDGRVVADGVALDAALVVAGVGVVARDDLARRAGITTERGVVVDAAQRTSHPAVWAAGDVARTDGHASEHWHSARDAGERAALSMLRLEVPRVAVPWTFTEVAGVPIDALGTGDADDERWLIDGSLVARSSRGMVTQLIVIGASVPTDRARVAVERGVRLGDALGFIGGTGT
jgi:3-phenylpropionate/trans-cinnamate dioxygenase ferredoxin reductase component